MTPDNCQHAYAICARAANQTQPAALIYPHTFLSCRPGSRVCVHRADAPTTGQLSNVHRLPDSQYPCVVETTAWRGEILTSSLGAGRSMGHAKLCRICVLLCHDDSHCQACPPGGAVNLGAVDGTQPFLSCCLCNRAKTFQRQHAWAKVRLLRFLDHQRRCVHNHLCANQSLHT